MNIFINIFQKSLLTLLTLTSTICFAQQITKTITIDVKKKDQFNLSQLASDVLSIPLEFKEGYEVFSVHKVFIVSNHIFILEGSEKNDGWPERILKYDMHGKFLAQIGLKDNSGQFLKTYDIFFRNEQNELLISYKNFYAVFDKTGKLKYTIENVPLHTIFNNKIWEIVIDFNKENEIFSYNLTSKDLRGTNKDTIYHLEHKIQKHQKVIAFPVDKLSVIGDILYVTIDIEDKIISIDKNNKVNTVYRFKFKNETKDPFRQVVHPPRYLFNKYIYYGYRNTMRDLNCYLYDREKDEGYNIQLNHGAFGKLTGGFKDDILNTGYLEFKVTNFENVVFFKKWSYEVDGIVKGITDNGNPVIFLVKLK